MGGSKQGRAGQPWCALMSAVIEVSVAHFVSSYFEMNYLRMVIGIYVGGGQAND